MNVSHSALVYWSLVGFLLCTPARADFIGVDILVARNLAGNQLVTGWYNDADGSRGAPQRVFGSVLEPTFAIDEPGIRAVDNALPAGTQALPGSTALSLDLVPMTINAVSANLFYWDGIGGVNFVKASPGTTFEVSTVSGFSVIADGSNATATDNDPFTTTSPTGFVHKHAALNLANGGTPDEGFYLISLDFRMPGLVSSDSAFLVFATSSFDGSQAHLAAGEWVEQNLAAVPEPSTLLLTALLVLALAGWYAPWRQASSLPIP